MLCSGLGAGLVSIQVKSANKPRQRSVTVEARERVLGAARPSSSHKCRNGGHLIGLSEPKGQYEPLGQDRAFIGVGQCRPAGHK